MRAASELFTQVPVTWFRELAHKSQLRSQVTRSNILLSEPARKLGQGEKDDCIKPSY